MLDKINALPMWQRIALYGIALVLTVFIMNAVLSILGG